MGVFRSTEGTVIDLGLGKGDIAIAGGVRGNEPVKKTIVRINSDIYLKIPHEKINVTVLPTGKPDYYTDQFAGFQRPGVMDRLRVRFCR